MTFDSARWQARFDELRAAHRVPGASLAVLVGGNVHELASGVLHRATGVEVTTDSVFLSGSLAKVYTATLVMQLVDSGGLELDTPVVSVLPEFATPDPEATKTIAIRRLLSHTGGLTCDFTYDSGRGDDCLARYDDGAHLRYEFVDGMKDFSPPLEMGLVPVTETVFAASGGPAFGGEHFPVVFSTLADGTECVYIGMRVTPKVA
ncbi:serine hydrolase domain-containing protein [Streptosporangium sp. V21-05]|uniref:serine hydrolase domain-containing protein n=1 Tax=Streptosporangium sp. V21-05 TaxID=3446115 RepID=UPI003F52DB68